MAEDILLQARRNLRDDALGFSSFLMRFSTSSYSCLMTPHQFDVLLESAKNCTENCPSVPWPHMSRRMSLCWCQIQRSHTTTRRAGTKNKLEGQTRRRRHGGEEYGKRVSPSHPTRGSGERHELPQRIWYILTPARGRGKDSRNFVVYATFRPDQSWWGIAPLQSKLAVRTPAAPPLIAPPMTTL